MTELWAGGLGIVTGLVLVLGAVSVHNRMRNRLRDAVVRSRPGAVVIPAFAEGPLPSALAIAVLGDRIEVWDGGGRHRTTMALTGATISVQRVRTGGGSYPGLRIEQGGDSLSFVPHFAATVRASDLERALRELGEDPADHLRP